MIEVSVFAYALFLWLMAAFIGLVAASVFVVGHLRLNRLTAQARRETTPLNPTAIRQNLQQVASPLDQLTPWHVPSPYDTETHAAVTSLKTPGPILLPLRPQDTLLYADSLSQA